MTSFFGGQVKLRRTGEEKKEVGLGLGLRPSGSAGFSNPNMVVVAPGRKAFVRPSRKTSSTTSPRRVETVSDSGRRYSDSVTESLVSESPIFTPPTIGSTWDSVPTGQIVERTSMSNKHKNELISSMLKELPWSSTFTYEKKLSTPVVVELWVIDTSALHGSGMLADSMSQNNYRGHDWTLFMLDKYKLPYARDYCGIIDSQLNNEQSVLILHSPRHWHTALLLTPYRTYFGLRETKTPVS
jgi:hypothetical protein